MLEGVNGGVKNCHGSGNVKISCVLTQHKRVNSASEISLKRIRDDQILEKQYRDESMPELFMDEAETQTLQNQ